MSAKAYFEKLLESATSLATDFTSDPVDVVLVDNVGINIDCTSVSDNTGSFYVDHRIYKNGNSFSAWAELTLDSTPQLANDDATFLISLNQLPKGQVRLRFVAAGSTPDGSCDVWVSGKEI